LANPTLPLDLDGGLRLRSSTPADADALAAFNGEIHSDTAGEPDRWVAAWTRDLLERPHPTFRPELFTIVEETDSGRIVSSLNLIPQTWAYDGIEFGVGRIELVGTHPDYRRRGLVRRQFEVAHRWSAAMGHLLQGITGIPWYYRQFGYAMALDLGGPRRLPAADVPQLAKDAPELFRLRPATPHDGPFIAAVDRHGRRRSLVSCVRDETLWRFEIDGRGSDNGERPTVLVVETAVEADSAQPARPVGFVVHGPTFWQGGLWVPSCELAAGESWLAVGPSVLRGLKAAGDAIAAATPAKDGQPAARLERIVLELGADHPLYQAVPFAEQRRPYAWYIRVPDLPAFLRRIAPSLDARLVDSTAAGFSGELALDFYTGGLRLTFDKGRLSDAVAAGDLSWRDAGAAFPPLTFLHLLLGHRSLTELERAHADCRARTPEARALIDALFPVRTSSVWPVS